jgi:hypothetical protein
VLAEHHHNGKLAVLAGRAADCVGRGIVNGERRIGMEWRR